ncbi:hypothetical protein BKA70DRAFT_1226015 [Coprinopsis sp. MPI-PUGE-AT-0042]|nr:hypothetical protein BKA70DRAFT_1226015 [Coprinopsis sp. MPI-PUGE-AT-0042]
MPVVTRFQSLRHGDRGDETCPENPGNKPLRRGRTGTKGQAQARLTRAIWENRLQNFKTDVVFLSGKTFARTVDPFTNIRKLLEDEVKVERELIATSQTWRHMIYPSHRLDQRRYLAIKSLLSPEEDITGCTVAVRNHIATLLSKGQSNAWSCDLLATQALVHRRLQVDCGEDVQEQCVQAEHLLRPIDQPSGETLMAFQAAPQPLSPGSWPAVLFQNMEFNLHQPEEGILMNRLLVTVYKAIHRGPGPKLPVTAASIAYIATLVVSAVAAPGTYPHRRMFRLLSEYLEQHQQTEWYRDLLRWWGRQVEGPLTSANVNLTHRTDSPKSGPSMLDRLKVRVDISSVA